jgi:hypothetical protein
MVEGMKTRSHQPRRIRRVKRGQIIASRTLTFAGAPGKAIRVSIGLPRRTRHGDWECPVLIEGLARSAIRDAAPGADSLQALILAVDCIRWHLTESGAEFEWMDSALLGGTSGAIPRQLPIGMGREFDGRMEAWIRRETERTRKFRAPVMRRWLDEKARTSERSRARATPRKR